MKEEKQTAPAPKAAAEPKFSKTQLLSAKKFEGRKDAMTAVLSDGETYTVKEAETLYDNYMKGQVN